MYDIRTSIYEIVLFSNISSVKYALLFIIYDGLEKLIAAYNRCICTAIVSIYSARIFFSNTLLYIYLTRLYISSYYVKNTS